jgi:tetratricopeptide (TPR) repeat protein
MAAVPATKPQQLIGIPLPEILQFAAERENAGRLDEAEALLGRVLAELPDHPEALHLMGVVAFRKKKVEQAVKLMERSLARGGGRPHYYRNLCEAYRYVGRYDEALAAGNKALAMAPDDPQTLTNLAILHYARLELDRTMELCERALKLDPKLPSAHFELSEALLLRGEFERGWDEYEWRYQIPGAGKLMPKTDRPQWDGKPLGNATLMLVADQGFGDAIQFCRYIPWAAERAPNLVVACSPELRPIIEQQPGVLRTFDRWELAGPFAAYCPLTGLPRLAKTRLETIPADVPYLAAEPALIERWRQRLSALVPAGHKRVGIVWAGRPTHNNDRNRSVPLSTFAPLGQIPGVSLLSLQKGPGQAQIAKYFGRAPLISLGPELDNYRDTMAVLDQLDLIVTVDTSVGHLAAAMGRPVWIMLPYAPDWRWLLQREDSPWYPSLRLFRQSEPKRWDDVMERVTIALRREAAGAGPG